MRDMATNFGGLLMGCYICERKPPKLQAISLRRFRSSVLLVRCAQPAEVRLRKTQAFFFAQNDRLIVCFVGCVCFGRMQANSASLRGKFASQNRPSPTGWGKVCKNLFVSGCRGRHPLPQILKFSVGAIHESPVFF